MSAYSNSIKLVHSFIVIILFVSCSNFIENKKFNRISENFIDQYFKFHPVEATLAGNHNYDHQLDNYSKENINESVRFFKFMIEKIASIDTNKLSNHNKVNYHILSSQLKLHFFELEHWKRWRRDATFYTQKIYDAIYGLQFHTQDTTENVTRNLIFRLDQFPKMLIQAKENLQHADVINLDIAIDHVENQKRMIAFQLSEKFVVTKGLIDSLHKKSEIVVDSLESFKRFLESKNHSQTDRSLPMNPEMYKLYIDLKFTGKVKLEQLIEWIDSDYQKNYDDILNTAKRYLSKQKNTNEFTINPGLNEKIDDEVEKQSLNKDEIIPYCYDNINDIKRFIDEIWNLSLPINYDVFIDWAADEQIFGLKLADFENPGLLEPTPRFYCLLKPILNDRDWIQQLSQLRAYNKPLLKVTMMLEATPSHYQIWFEKLDEIPILARAFPDQSFVSAWHYYFTFSMINAGFEGYDPELRYVLLKSYARILLLAKVEIQYYLQQFTNQQAEQLLLESKMFNKNEIKEVIRQVNRSVDQFLTIYWGIRQFKKLEEAYRQKSGPYFNDNEFFQYILKHGPIPVELIKRNGS